MKRGALAIGLCLGLAASGCGGSEDPPAKAPKVFVTPAPEGEPYDQLSDWHLFENGPSQKPAERVVPYEVISPLWSDGASKHRFIHLPEGKTIGYSEDRWKFPVGSILVKTFGYLHDQRDASAGERLLETRLLVHESDGWKAHTYVWNDEQTDAVRKSAGTTLSVSTIDSAGASVTFDYGVPNSTKCSECHGKDAPDTLGGKTRQLDRDHDYGKGPENQIDHLYDLGFLDAAPRLRQSGSISPTPWEMLRLRSGPARTWMQTAATVTKPAVARHKAAFSSPGSRRRQEPMRPPGACARCPPPRAVPIAASCTTSCRASRKTASCSAA